MRKNKKSKSKINVITSYDGLKGDLVEVIERVTISRKNCDKRTKKRMGPAYELVSYKGKLHEVFLLPECYGKIRGNCISIN